MRIIWSASLVLSLWLSACGSSNPSDFSSSFARGAFPQSPDARLTPGDLCTHPTAHRYPEHISYCERNVESTTKQAVIAEYDARLGYSIGEMNRAHFKIDHYIPLCVGGSNETANLWPQHQSVYEYTDAIEGHLCTLMQRGDMLQAEAIQLIKQVKNHLETARAVENDLLSRIRSE